MAHGIAHGMDRDGAGHGDGTIRGIVLGTTLGMVHRGRGIALGTILGIRHGMVITIIGMLLIGAPTTTIPAMDAAPAVHRWAMVAT